MEMSSRGLMLLQQLEGIKELPYRDSAGLLTIGCGHLLTRDELTSGKIICGETTIRWKDGPLSEDDINTLLTEDLSWAEVAVESNIDVPLSQSQFDALVCFAFNIGVNAFRNSTLCRELNNGNYSAVPEQMKRWNKIAGGVSHGLTNRRLKEIALWESE